MAADRELLLGLLALQNNFIDRDALVAAFNSWGADPSRSLGQILLERGALSGSRHALLEQLVQEHIRLHDGDAQESLAAFGSIDSVREELLHIGDAELQKCLARIPSSRTEADDPYQTVVHSRVGASSSTGTRFRVIRPHAKGGLGEVFLALDTELNREVALKEIQARFADDQRYRSRFEFEAQVTGGLEHPGIVPVYGRGRTPEGRPFYAMRFVKGDSLKEAIRRFQEAEKRPDRNPGQSTLELRELLGRFIDVCDAVAYSHSRRLLHRDLKPGNIMLGKYGETLVVDWGLAKALDAPEPGSPHDGSELPLRPASSSALEPTEAGSAVGTPAYMSPEQVESKAGELGVRTDVYCLGATLYHLLTGHAPCEAEQVGEIYRKVLAGDIPRPRLLNSRIEPALEAICLKALALRPDDRYVSAGALKADLERWLADEPVTVHADAPWVRLGRWSRRHRVATTVLVLFLTVLVPGLLAANALLRRERQHAVDNFRQTRAAILRFVALADESKGRGTVEELRRAIGATAKDYYERFLAEREGDPSLTAELAWTHFQIATFILLELGEQLRQFRMQSPSPPPARAAPAPPSVSKVAIRFPPTLPTWEYRLFEASRNNETAIMLYRQLMARHPGLKEREYELCQQQQTLIEELRRSPDQFDVSSIPGPGFNGPGFGGGLEAASAAFPMIGD
jgi:serine/threonine-protein kinase